MDWQMVMWLLCGIVTLSVWVINETRKKEWSIYHAIFVPLIILLGPVSLTLLILKMREKYKSSTQGYPRR